MRSNSRFTRSLFLFVAGSSMLITSNVSSAVTKEDVDRLVDQYSTCIKTSAKLDKNRAADNGRVSVDAINADCATERSAIATELPADIGKLILATYDATLPKVVDGLAAAAN